MNRSARGAHLGRMVAIVLTLLAAAVGCTGHAVVAQRHVQIVVDHPTALIDIPIDIRVEGLSAHERISISAEASDAKGGFWRSQASFVTDDHGIVDLATTPPVSGSYSGAQAMGSSGPWLHVKVPKRITRSLPTPRS